MDSVVKNRFHAALCELAQRIVRTMSNDPILVHDYGINFNIFQTKLGHNVCRNISQRQMAYEMLRLHFFPYFIEFADREGYIVEFAGSEDIYPNMIFSHKRSESLKFAVDIHVFYANAKWAKEPKKLKIKRETYEGRFYFNIYCNRNGYTMGEVLESRA